MKKLFAAAAAATLLAASFQANATLLSAGPLSSTAQTGAVASVPDTAPAWSTTMFLPLFNSALGTLNRVTLNVSGQLNSTVTVDNLESDSTSFTNLLTGNISFSAPVFGSLVIVLEATDSATLPGLDSYGPVKLNASGSQSPSTSDANELLQFIGSGNFAVDVSADGNWDVQGAGNLGTDGDALASARISVVYDYTARTTNVPEPGALALVGLALAAASFARRRPA